MKFSFDGFRRNLAYSYNVLVDALPDPTDDQIEAMASLRQDVGISLCIYDDEIKDDMTMLADEIELLFLWTLRR